MLLLIAVATSAIALLYARREYRARGKLTLVGLFLLCAMLFVPNLVVHFSFDYEMPVTGLDYLGTGIAFAGVALCLSAMLYFRSLAKILCLASADLTVRGPYRWSRNPQYVGWVLFLLGFLLNDISLWGLAALAVVAISLHLLVLIEEEHLRRVFAGSYDEYTSRVPRYFGLSGG
jgi:protein-S-isoprenylcysteine O-methyltransferase Ste14